MKKLALFVLFLVVGVNFATADDNTGLCGENCNHPLKYK